MYKLAFFIDRVTNNIENAATFESAATDIIALSQEGLKRILKRNGWRFNWKSEFTTPNRLLYKLVVKGGEIIEGLISLELTGTYIEMHLIETAPHNFGKSKKWIGVPGNLVAFACKMSFECGFDGFVGFRPKTRLIQHYIDTLGAELISRNRMRISGIPARKSVNSYYKDYFNDR